MILLGKLRLEIFVSEHEGSRIPLGAWQLEAEEAEWSGPEEVQERYAGAVVQPDRVLFSIKDIYKLDVKAKFKQGVLLIERVWTTKVSKRRSASTSAILRSKA